MEERIFGIIVTYNPDTLLLNKQYQSLKDQIDGLIYIDNGSYNSVEIEEFLHGKKNTFIISNSDNMGLGYAQNQGIKKAMNEEVTHVVLFDQDSVVTANFIPSLRMVEKEMSEKGIKVGAVGPLFRNISENVPSISPGYIFNGMKIKKIILGKEPLAVSYCISSGTLIPIKVLKDTGLINENLFVDGMDVEWCCRAGALGYKIFITPSVIMDHALGIKADEKRLTHSPLREYYICRNNILLSRYRHIPLGYRLRKIFFTPLRVLRHSLSGYKEYYKMGVRGLRDGIMKKEGKYQNPGH